MNRIHTHRVSVWRICGRWALALIAAGLMTAPLLAQASRPARSAAPTAQRSSGARGAYKPRAAPARAASARKGGSRHSYARRDGGARPAPRHRGYRGYRGRHYYGGRSYHGYYYPYRYYPYRYYHPYFWHHYFWPHYWGPSYWTYRYDYNSGAIDINVRPKKTQIHLNGHYIGTAGQFDGLPGYLWLRKGTYELIFYLEGHRTVRKVYDIYPGVVIRERFTMTSGESIPVEELTEKPPPVVRVDDSDHRRDERSEAPRRYRLNKPPAAKAQAEPEAAEDLDLRSEPGRAQISATPGDASVYLDGRFLGTAEDLARRGGEVILDPGEHRVQVSRPGYREKDITFVVRPGETTTVNVVLDER